MELTDIPTEQTTALTDVVLALLALGCSIYLQRIKRAAVWKANLWSWAFGLLALAALLGAVVHGLVWTEATATLLWRPLNLSLGLTIALFVVGVIYDTWGASAARRALPVMLTLGVIFFLVTLVLPGTFLVFIIYQAISMLFALGCYAWLGLSGRLRGATLMTAGVLVSLAAAGVQASGSVSWTFFWTFDHNGVFHLLQMVGVMLLTGGLRAALVDTSTGRGKHYWNWGQE